MNPKSKKEESRRPDPKEPFCGLVFKASWHPNGHRFFIRVYSGTLKPNSRALNNSNDKKENVAKLFHVHADPNRGLEEVPLGLAGDIVAVIGLKESRTGDTLTDTVSPLVLPDITFAEAVVSRSIEPESGADKDKLAQALDVLQLEDPTFIVKADKDTGQTLMSGMGTLHLEVKQHRMERDFRLKVRVGEPRVSYRETLKSHYKADVEVTRMGDRDVYAGLTVEFTNHKSLTPVTVSNFVSSDVLPNALGAAAEQALRDALQTGEFGFPMMNVQAKILAAKVDPQKSTDEAFVRAAVEAYREATKGNVLLLEPIMKVVVTTPGEFLGNVIGDLSSRRGQIERQEPTTGGLFEVEALVPLRVMFRYADEVRSLSQGRAAGALEPHSYEPAPQEVVRQLLGD